MHENTRTTKPEKSPPGKTSLSNDLLGDGTTVELPPVVGVEPPRLTERSHRLTLLKAPCADDSRATQKSLGFGCTTGLGQSPLLGCNEGANGN